MPKIPNPNDNDNINPNALLEGDDPNLPFPSEDGDGDGDEELTPYFRDLSEDDVYDRLNRVNEFQPQLTAMESRLSGGVNSIQSRLEAFEKGLPTQAAFDIEKLTAGLEAYDPALAKVLGPLMQEAFKVNALDETTLRPHLDPMQEQMQKYVGEQLVMSAYSPEAIAEIIPAVKDGRFMPEGQRQKDFADWYGQQGYDTQQGLLSFGAPYINALRKFEKWEKERNTQRATTAATKQGQLDKGQVPSSQNRRTAQTRKLSDDEAFAAGFEEAINN